VRLKMYVSAHASKRTRYTISDSPITADARQVSISQEDLVSYLQAKQEYERWQERMKAAKRCYGGGWV
jgi:hypothetical protein